MKKIKCCSIIFTVLFFLIFTVFVIFIICDCPQMYSLFSGISGIIATIAFGFWVSFSFQKANDKKQQQKDDEIKKIIRTEEFAKIRYHLSSMVRTFYSREDQLVAKIKGLKNSFTKNTIDIENLTFNYFVFDEIYNNIENYFKDSDEKKFIKANIDALYMRDTFHGNYIENTIYDSSETYQEFSEFNDECIRLYKKMNKLNLDFKLSIFNPEEIKAIYPFSNKINIGWFLNFNSPYEIIKMFEYLPKIVNFIDSDFVPYYKKENFWSDFERKNLEEKEYEEKISNWMNENKNKAQKFLNE